ncbi:unnamed protein product [Meganyctiphanes norvegica]|uniref:Aldehyde oxidase n=1 Tax=Meganyctiphanes norvegica TaxID=48144 RepID=A0AAV2QND9_MEGNR
MMEGDITDGSVGDPPIVVTINNKTYTVGPEVPPWTTLVDFIRERAKLPGTKYLCREGGCGVCTVVATRPDPLTPGASTTHSLHSCQTLVYSCAGWSIETIENLGNRYDGYHSLQKALTGFYGTQCGYCSPGMIMAMYGQMKSLGSVSSEDVEATLDGNLCRCTGYRPILDAFKSLATDAPEHLKNKLVDIEDAYKNKCSSTGNWCKGVCKPGSGDKNCSNKVNGLNKQAITVPEEFMVTVGAVIWYRPTSLEKLYNILRGMNPQVKVKMIAGNTGEGVYKSDFPYSAYISIASVIELYNVQADSSLSLGACLTLRRCIEAFEHMADNTPGFQHLAVLAEHWKKVANTSVRNMGSWAGNLMLKHNNPEFPSDVFLTLYTAGAKLTIGNSDTKTGVSVTLDTFLQMEMNKNVILGMTLPPIPRNVHIRTFKITPRSVNAHAYVNAGFRLKINPKNGFQVIEVPTIAYGGINPNFIQCEKAGKYLLNRKLSDSTVLLKALKLIGQEVVPNSEPQLADPKYRTLLAQTLFYKTVIKILGKRVSAIIRSGGLTLDRPLSSGSQVFDMNKETWPVGEPIPKIESTVQCSGEAEYVNDIPASPDEVHGAFVLSQYACATIKHVDPAPALAVPGVLSYVSSSDIPGKNSFVAKAGKFVDPIFAEEGVLYCGQPIGLIVAEDRDIAVKAAKLVQIEYSDIETPVLTIQEALEKGRYELAEDWQTGEAEEFTKGNFYAKFRETKHKLVGQLVQGTQFHLTMEPLSARVVPIEDGYDVFCTTQWPTETQESTAQVLGIPAHRINVSVRRIGGGYGAKISRQHIVSGAAAVAARKLKRTVRINLDLHANMAIAGWREPYLSKYEVGFDDTGRVEALKIEITSDAGHCRNNVSSGWLRGRLQNCYEFPSLIVRPLAVTTDTAANTWCRAPGSTEAVATTENIMEHIATYLQLDPLEVRKANMLTMLGPVERNVLVEDILPILEKKIMYQQRKQEIASFNKANRWRKKGLSILPLLYPLHYPSSFRYGIQVVIYEHDGTVAISHGGIEMGQGINTKVAQVAAHTLNIPLELVTVKASNTMAGANSKVTGGSYGSDLCAHGVKVACSKIIDRMTTLKEDEQTWQELVKKCHSHDLDLCERYWTASREHPDGYSIWAAASLEVELDVLTGQYLIQSCDIVEDCGRSMNPYVDIGQIEGSLIMGFGMYTSEEVKFEHDTGKKISTSTWEYKVPTAFDIPVKMNVTLLPNANNPFGVLGSKATGEPALNLTFVVVTALREAIASARADAGTTGWFTLDTPLTVEKIQQLCLVKPRQMVLRSSEEQDTLDIEDEDFVLVETQQIPDVSSESQTEDSCRLT